MATLSDRLIIFARKLEKWAKQLHTDVPPLRPEFAALTLSGHALQALLDWYQFDTVLDIGSGAGIHAKIMETAGKTVTRLDFGRSIHFQAAPVSKETIIGNFLTAEIDQQFDCVWCSHVLEHQSDPQAFLKRVHRVLPEDGILALTVPPRKDEIVGGHLSLWNGGLLLYHLVLAGFDCRNAQLLQYGYNLSLLLRKHTVKALPALDRDSGDIRRIRAFLPGSIDFKKTEFDDVFDGFIWRLNWQPPDSPAR